MDLYKVLDISPSADFDEIKLAYKRASMKYHPDKGGDEEMFKNIQDAYAILSDEGKRKYYDASRKVYAKGEIVLDLNDMDIKTDIKMGMGVVEIKRVVK
jgi:DnaJ-class molecular chaperone